MMTRWLSCIQLFDFDAKYVKGAKNWAADALSRRRHSDGDESEDGNVDDYFETRMYSIAGEPVWKKSEM
jgi:hypothetical protein